MGRGDALSTTHFKLSDDETMDIDRFDALPDDVVCRILSFLPTKLSVSTSILAKRWRFMWAHVPVLDFQHPSESNIVSSVLMRHKVQHTHTFRLNKIICSTNELETWITTLTDCNVRILDLSFYKDLYLSDHARLPPCLFTWKALVDLSLCYCRTIPMNATTVFLPALKKLSLFQCVYESDESLPHLLSGCPVLEELTILTMARDNMMCCYISSPTLSELSLTRREKTYERKGYKVKLDTPALRYLELEDSVSEYLSAGALTSLTEAYLDLNAPMTLAYARSVLEFVSRLYNVEYLTLWAWEIEVPDSEFSAFTTKFHNLVELELDVDWRFLTKLLENADNLHDLEINGVRTILKAWKDPKQVPACLVSHLESVRITHFVGKREDEFDMVRYFLKNAKVLEMMDIYVHHTEKKQARERISLFERGSDACRINIFGYGSENN